MLTLTRLLLCASLALLLLVACEGDPKTSDPSMAPDAGTVADVPPGETGGGDVANPDDAAEAGETGAVELPGLPVGSFRVAATETPPALHFYDQDGAFVTTTAPGSLRLARVDVVWEWLQGFLGFEETTLLEDDLADTALALSADGDGLVAVFRDDDGAERARVEISAIGDVGLLLAVTPGALSDGMPADRVHLRFACDPRERFFGLGGQSQSTEHRGQTIPIRVTEQGLGKDPAVPESAASTAGHVYDAYFPLPYLLVARPAPEPRAHGLLLLTEQRSRFLVCSEDEQVLEIQAAATAGAGLDPGADDTLGARLVLLPGPTPKDVVRQFTALEGRPLPLPRWAFGPWVAIVGDPAEVQALAPELITHDLPATAIWHQDFRDYHHPDLPAMVDAVHAGGWRILAYFNTFLVQGHPLFEEALAAGYLPTTPEGDPYLFQRVTETSSQVDLTNPGAWAWMRGRLEHALSVGVDGWMADYAEWVAPDMHFHDGRVGEEYANLYTVDWARVNDEALRNARPDGDALFFSRSGYLGANRHLRVVWAGDQMTDFGRLDGLPSVIAYGVNLGLAGVSAFAHDIAGYTGIVSPPSTKELYFRWTALGAFSPVMRTHRGYTHHVNWNWDRDEDTVAHFRRYALLHLRLLPYLEMLHAEAVATGVPAMRHPVLEFPDWEGATPARGDTFLLGPSLLVAPVVEANATRRTVPLPPGTWYALEDGKRHDGPATPTVDAPPEAIPVFLRAGGIVPLLPDTVRLLEPAAAHPDRQAVTDVEEKKLTLLLGAGGEGTLTLADGTEIAVTQAPDGLEGAGVRLAADGDDLPTCGPGQTPAGDACIAEDLGGSCVVAGRNGPGNVWFGGGATGGSAWVVSVAGGPAGRAYELKLYRGE